MLALGGVALAAVPTGLQNASFENGLTGWTGITNGVSGNLGAVEVVTGADQFSVKGFDTETDTVREDVYTVSPQHGNRMILLGEIAHDRGVPATDRGAVEQTFRVDPAHPILNLRANIFSWDSFPYDETDFVVRMTDGSGALIFGEAIFAQSDGRLNNTGWFQRQIDLRGHEGDQVHLHISSGATVDPIFGTWAYIDGIPADSLAPGAPRILGPAKVRLRGKKRAKRIRFTIQAEAGATLRCSVDGRPFVACGSTFLTPKLKKGRHVLRVEVTDRYGNKSVGQKSVMIKKMKRKRRARR